MNFSLPLQIRQILGNLGFLDGEIRILEFLFIQKKATAKDISQNTGLSFDGTHFSLVNLEHKKLVRTHNNTSKEDVFEVCSEREFKNWIEKQKKKNVETYENAILSFQSLFTNLRQKSWKPDVRYFEGKEGLIEIYEDMLNSKDKKIYSWIDIQKIHDFLGKEYLMNFIDQRIKKDIKVYAILPINGMNIEHESRDENREAKFIDKFLVEGEMRIYDDKVAVITFDKENPVAFLFQGRVITELFKNIFLGMWANLTDAT